MIRPLNDGIVVKPDAPKPHAVFVLPDEEVFTGVVVAAGPGKRLPSGGLRPIMVSIGDHIQYSGTIDMKYGDYLLMKDKDVIGLV